MRSHLTLTFALVFSLNALAITAANAQEVASVGENWYRVDLIIFRQGGNPKTQVEQWDTDINMSYPLAWQVLMPAPPAPETADTSSAPNDSTATPTATETPAGDTDLIDALANVDPSRKLQLLPDTGFALLDHVKRLTRSDKYRVMFYGSWEQGMQEREAEPAILIEGGLRFDQHHELAGSILLKLQRYLHIETNLWLTDFAANTGQERQAWPELPWPPYKPRPLQNLESAADSFDSWSQFQLPTSRYDSLLLQPYVIENIALIQQKRRMRSKELHYIDHPLVGILIQFTPLPGPTPVTTTPVNTTPTNTAPTTSAAGTTAR